MYSTQRPLCKFSVVVWASEKDYRIQTWPEGREYTTNMNATIILILLRNITHVTVLTHSHWLRKIGCFLKSGHISYYCAWVYIPCHYSMVMRMDLRSSNLIVTGFGKRDHFALKVDFELATQWQSTVDKLSVAICCASIAAPVTEICLLKVSNYARRDVGKTAFKHLLPVVQQVPHTIRITIKMVGIFGGRRGKRVNALSSSIQGFALIRWDELVFKSF